VYKVPAGGLETERNKLTLGRREYELTNHLGNVLAAVSDAKLPTAKVLSHTDYYAFGSAMPGRSGGAGYRYGFNGMERDNATSIEALDFGARIHSPSIGRWLSVDPLAEKSPNISPYAFVSNNPINRIDPDGKQDYPFQYLFRALGGIAGWLAKKTESNIFVSLSANFKASGGTNKDDKSVTEVGELGMAVDRLGNYALFASSTIGESKYAGVSMGAGVNVGIANQYGNISDLAGTSNVIGAEVGLFLFGDVSVSSTDPNYKFSGKSYDGKFGGASFGTGVGKSLGAGTYQMQTKLLGFRAEDLDFAAKQLLSLIETRMEGPNQQSEEAWMEYNLGFSIQQTKKGFQVVGTITNQEGKVIKQRTIISFIKEGDGHYTNAAMQSIKPK
jgi:RHS repeat-associated protein